MTQEQANRLREELDRKGFDANDIAEIMLSVAFVLMLKEGATK